MKILHVITSLLTGGAEKLMVDLLPRLQSAGNEVELAVFNGTRTPFYQQLEESGIKIHPLSKDGNVYNPKYVSALRNLLPDYDIVHSHNTSAQLYVAIANHMNGGEKKPLLVTTEHNTTNRRRSMPFFKPVDKWMYGKYERVICISHQAAINLGHYLPVVEPKICTIFNGVDTARFMALVPPKQRDDEKILITMVAAFRAQKDQTTLIRALSLLPEKFELQLIGKGEDSLVASCQKLAKDLGVLPRVQFLGMRTDVPELLASSDIVVLSSHYEGLSLSSIEGMASGKPFVASDVDGLHEIVDGYGILFPHQDHKQLALEMMKLADNSEYAQQVATRCQQRASQYDISFMATEYLKLYEEIRNQ